MFAAKGELFTVPSGYQISRSVRLRSSATAYLQRTNGTTGTDPLKFTVSGWMKRGLSTVNYFPLLGSNTGTNAFDFFGFADNNIAFRIRNSSSVDLVALVSSAVFRDFSAWYHLVAVYDSANATSTERVKLYVNGVQITAFATSTYPSLNQGMTGTFLTDMQIGRTNTNSTNQNYGDGYVTEINFVDGQALTPSSFGEYDSITGVWKPKKYTGTYGTNGFYLNFSDNSAATAAAIGKDYSGNANNWTPNNISVTAGVTYDSMLDVPTPFADGSTGRGNYAVMNPLDNSGATISNGNLQVAANTGTFQAVRSGFVLPTGSWYVEVTATTGTGNGNSALGIALQSTALSTISGASNFVGASSTSWGYSSNGNVYNNNSIITATGVTWAAAAVIGITFDGSTLKFYKNNVLVTTVSSIPTGNYCIASSFYSSDACAFNFGQRPFSYTPPSGFLAVNTQNLPTPTIANGASYMAATTYTGTGAAQSISNAVNGVSFQPDFIWFKSRAQAYSNALYDSVRGRSKALVSNSTDAEDGNATSAQDLTSFNSNGFSLGTVYFNSPNNSASNPVAWQWNAGGSTVTNTSGSISAQVRANATAGFSIVTYTGTGAAATIGHGLGVAPSMIIFKSRTQASVDWPVYHISTGNDGGCNLNETAAKTTSSTKFNNTTPTSTVFSVGSAAQTNGSTQSMLAYCFAAVAGYSAFGSYTGNGSADGPFVFTGFRPRFLMVKRTDGVGDWMLLDSSRDTSNLVTKGLAANLSSAEGTGDDFDFVANGFKLRDTGTGNNANGGTYIYMAFAENPFKYSLAR